MCYESAFTYATECLSTVYLLTGVVFNSLIGIEAI